ncbi:MAG: hypothetical protein IT318_09730, partial [Anaerolineales bacterium]|nr:hypothetical protein [Anaerolineales bacterium]
MHSQVSRRQFLHIAGLGLTTLGLAACVAPAAAPAASDAPATEGEVIAFWIPVEEWGQFIQDEFNAADVGVTAEWQLGEYDSNTKTMAALAAGSPPSVSFLGRWQHPDLAARNAIVDLEDYIQN